MDKQVDPQLTMSLPMAIASHEGQLYVADSENGKVLIVTPDGKVNRVVTLAKGAQTDSKIPRPIGIVVWSDGSFAVSDANNNRLIKYGPDGTMLWTVGTGSPDPSDTGFNTPSGLALDKDGNVYVVDILNSKVKKYSSDGQFISKFGQLGDAAGEFSRAKTVAIDDLGNVYVSDGLQRAVEVFDQSRQLSRLGGSQGSCRQELELAIQYAARAQDRGREAVRGRSLCRCLCVRSADFAAGLPADDDHLDNGIRGVGGGFSRDGGTRNAEVTRE